MEDPGRGEAGSTRRMIGWLVAALLVLGVPAVVMGSCSTRKGCGRTDPNEVAAPGPQKHWYGVGDALGVCV